MASEMLHDAARVHGTDEQMDMPTVETTTHARGRSRSRTHRSRRDVVCWHCGRRGHTRQRCFRRMRQHKKRKLHGTQMTDATTISPCPLFQRLLLDMSAVFHAIPHREWFSTYSAERHDCADTDSLGSDVAGVGDVHLHFVDGASMVLHDVRHIPTMIECLVSIPCLRDDGYAVMHTEHSWRIHRGSLVVARGACCGTDFPFFPSYIRAGAVYVVALPCREVERRRVSFQDALSHAIHDTDLPLLDVQIEPVVQTVCGAIHTEDDIFGNAQLGQSLVEVTVIAPEMDAFFFDVSDAFEVYSDLDTAVQDMSAVAEVERHCSSESQQWESDCSGAALSILQSFSEMPLPDAMREADRLPGRTEDTQDIPVWTGSDDAVDAYGAELADMVTLAEIAHVSSAFGSLMYDLLVSRPDIAAAAVGAFAVGVVSRAITDTGIEHMGALQVVTRYLQQQVHVRSDSIVAHVAYTLERIQVHARFWSEPVGIG